MGVPISSFTFENVDYEIKDAVARDAMASLNGFEYAICSTTENTPSGVSFTDSDTGFTVTGTLAASSSTKNMIYLVPANGGEAKDVYEEYITVELIKTVNDAETTVYQWEKIGSTAIDLNGYLTTDDAAAFAPKNAPVFTGSISMGRVEGSTVGQNSVAIGNGVVATHENEFVIGKYSNTVYPDAETIAGMSHFSTFESYNVGDYVLDQGWPGEPSVYRCIQAITASSSLPNYNSAYQDTNHWELVLDTPYSFVVGNGTDDTHRSNAVSIDLNGNAKFAGKITVGAAPVNDMDITTKKYVDDNVSRCDVAWYPPKSVSIGREVDGMALANNLRAGTLSNGKFSAAEAMYSHAVGIGSKTLYPGEIAAGIYNALESYNDWDENTQYYPGDIVYNYGPDDIDNKNLYRLVHEQQIGHFDIENWELYSKYLLVVGNGTDDEHRSNAFTVDTNGNAVFAGKATVGAAPVNDMDVATKKYVDDNAGGGSNVDTSTLATKADPVFTGSISMGRDANSTAGTNSVATGVNVVAEGNQSHAEGMMTKAIGENSHAEGTWTNASGGNSHVEGLYTTALGKSEHVSGQFNVLDTATTWVAGTSYNVGDVVSRVENGVTKIYRCKTANSNASWASSNWEEYGQYLFVVGNGTDGNNRSNAFSVDWDGNTKTSGKMVVGKYNEVIDVNTIAGWSGGTSYNVGDLVSYVPGPGGAVAYRCILSFSDNPGGSTTPPTYDSSHWQYVNGTAPLFAVGNGTDEQHRANAFAVDEYGNAVFAGKATVGTAPQGAMDVTTKEYVDSEIRKKDIHEYPPVYLTIGTDDLEHSIWNGTDYRPGTLANGRNNRVEAHYAHAEGVGSHAIYPGELATGKYNIIETYDAWDTSKAYEIGDIVTHPDPDEPYAWTNIYRCVAHQNAGSFDFANWELYSKYLLVVGNGIEDAHRSNAATIDWDGNAVFAGKATVGAAPVNDMDVATKKYVDDNAGGSSSDNPVFTGSISMGRAANSTVGQNSVAVGNNVIASGDNSHAEGSEHVTTVRLPYWSPNTAYNVGDCVYVDLYDPVTDTLHDGDGMYECLIAHTSTDDVHNFMTNDVSKWKVLDEAPKLITPLTAQGSYSHAEGVGASAFADASHAEGSLTKAYGMYSHAEGCESIAYGWSSHAEGASSTTTAFANYAHAEGSNTIANGYGSHVEGIGTITNSDAAHVGGQYNLTLDKAVPWEKNTYYKVGDIVNYYNEGFYECTSAHTSTSGANATLADGKWQRLSVSKRDMYPIAFAIGNGTDDQHRSNAFTVDWSGNATAQTSITIGNTTINEAQLQALLALLNTQNANGQSF